MWAYLSILVSRLQRYKKYTEYANLCEKYLFFSKTLAYINKKQYLCIRIDSMMLSDTILKRKNRKSYASHDDRPHRCTGESGVYENL